MASEARWRQGFQSLAPEPLQRRLQRQVQRGADQRRSRQRCRELGRVARQRDAGGRYRRGPGIEQAGADADRQHAVPHGGCGDRVAVRAQPFRPARDGDQQGGLRRFQRLRRHAEPGERAGAHSFQVAAERRQGEPDVEDALPAVAGFELHGAGHLDQFGAEGARSRLEQAGGLHRQRRAAGDDVAGAENLRGGADEGEGIDAGVVPEAAVLDRDEQIGEQRAVRRRHGSARRRRAREAARAAGPGGRGPRCPTARRRERSGGKA